MRSRGGSGCARPDGGWTAARACSLCGSGKKGTVSLPIRGNVMVEVKDGHAVVALRPGGESARNLYGLYRTLVGNMGKGVVEGFTKTAEIAGVGSKDLVKKSTLQSA